MRKTFITVRDEIRKLGCDLSNPSRSHERGYYHLTCKRCGSYDVERPFGLDRALRAARDHAAQHNY